jgi:hypothetical protein
MLDGTTTAGEAAASATEFAFTCRAEIADCTCPENCERDHGND